MNAQNEDRVSFQFRNMGQMEAANQAQRRADMYRAILRVQLVLPAKKLLDLNNNQDKEKSFNFLFAT